MSSSTALEWFKSTYSSDEGGQCLEIAPEPTAIHIRDSKAPGIGHLTITPVTWAAFLPLARGCVPQGG
ncbi:hypothetical protein GCM10018785_57570 [Streptomyces longispororuber]|uniref:DUF397 domain-containing protein n=1 Tax=Streptomyces longispororuber TaxID=68230 RepID=A0A919A1H6_9ACTN|nr:DUF397 domain-containing protein [Streptomyces longispororuber]GHE81979.1 hypothetical protein GCM10018785_57570 [Streptomyces longispororuber]